MRKLHFCQNANQMCLLKFLALSSTIAIISLSCMAELINPPQCRICQEWGHKTRECPLIESEDDFDKVESVQEVELPLRLSEERTTPRNTAPAAMDVDRVRAGAAPKMTAAITTPRRSATQRSTTRARGSTDVPTEDQTLAVDLNEDEMKIILRRRERQREALQKKANKAALTGLEAPYPSLSTAWSEDIGFNILRSVQSRLLTFQWKKLVWLLRVRSAVHQESHGRAVWKRNPRWLDLLLAREVAALWGHFGAMRQKLAPTSKSFSRGKPSSSRGA